MGTKVGTDTRMDTRVRVQEWVLIGFCALAVETIIYVHSMRVLILRALNESSDTSTGMGMGMGMSMGTCMGTSMGTKVRTQVWVQVWVPGFQYYGYRYKIRHPGTGTR